MASAQVMGLVAALALILSPAQGFVLKIGTDVTPLQKLIQLLDEMVAKGKTEKQAEQVEFAKFDEWCDGVRKEKGKSIADAADQIEQLEADIQKGETDAAVLSEEIKARDAKIAKDEKELESADEQRKKR